MKLATLQMTQPQFEKLREIVYKRSGIDFQEPKKYILESRLSRRLEELGFDNYDQYLAFLTMGPYQADEFQEMFNRITINETSFFRNVPQLEVFEDHVLPSMLDARRDRKQLRIWSSACSTGEEPYTLAMMIHRTLGPRLADWRIEILGTDISEKVLIAAQTGRYPAYSVRNTDSNILKRYFREVGGFYQLDPTIMSMVTFNKLNLKDDQAARCLGRWDIIFCRNVLIYFDDDMKKHCANLFYDQLETDGVLFIGHSESLRDSDAPFEPMGLPQAYAYTRVRNRC